MIMVEYCDLIAVRSIIYVSRSLSLDRPVIYTCPGPARIACSFIV